MTDREYYELEMELIHKIGSNKLTLWQKVLAVLELNAVSDHR